MTKANHLDYLASISEELNSQCKRVRNLIGNKHWLTDGHHHESVLLSLLERHITGKYHASRGFVVDTLRAESSSTEQDILIIDSLKERPIFDQFGVVITPHANVAASISVKANLTKPNVVDSVEGLSTIYTGIPFQKNDVDPVWSGAFFYDHNDTVQNTPSIVLDYLEEIVEKELVDVLALPNVICSSNEFVYASQANYQENRLHYYCLRYQKLSSAVFIAHLAEHLAHRDGESSSFNDMLSLINPEQLGHITFELSK